MLFPLGDDIPTRRAPVMTWFIIAANAAVFVYFNLQLPEPQLERWVLQWGYDVERPFSIQMLTSMFMHGGIGHILGNMWMLWIVGNNVEDKVGRIRYLLLYLLGGCAAALAFWAIDHAAPPNVEMLERYGRSHAPLVGASGAIAAVMGIYLIFFPEARIRLLLWWFLFIRIFPVRAKWFIGMSLALDLARSIYAQGAAAGGVATMAHVGGGVFGIVVALLLKPLVGGGAEGTAWDVHSGFSRRPSAEATDWVDSPPHGSDLLRPQQDQVDVVELERTLVELVRSQRLREAIDLYPAYVAHRREKPLPPDVQMDIADEFYRQGLVKHAIAAYRRYLDADPHGEDAAEAKFRLGVLYAKGTSDRAQAARWLREAIAEHRDPRITAAAREFLAALGD
jgi:membrane associated rhomboid family serine protease